MAKVPLEKRSAVGLDWASAGNCLRSMVSTTLAFWGPVTGPFYVRPSVSSISAYRRC